MAKQYAIHGFQSGQLEGNFPGLNLVATSELCEASQKKLSETHPDLRHYKSLEELLESEKLDLVSVATQQNRFQAIEQIVEQKIPVLACEPLARSDEELQALHALKEKAPIYPRLYSVFHPCVKALIEIVESGELGQLLQIEVEQSDSLQASSGTLEALIVSGLGWMMAFGCGKPEILKVARVQKEGQEGDYKSLCALLRFPDGSLGSLNLHHGPMYAQGQSVGTSIRLRGTEGLCETRKGMQAFRICSNIGGEREETGFFEKEEQAFQSSMIDAILHQEEKAIDPQTGFDIAELDLLIKTMLSDESQPL